MKRNNILSKLVLFAAVAGFTVACNDYDAISEPYDTDRNDPFVPTPPTLDPSWQLEMIENQGQHGPNVFVYKDKKYDALFTRTLGWNGGDGVMTAALPDGNVFWSFNDSFYGVADGETRTRHSTNFPRNSIMIQRGTPGKLGETDDDLVWMADFVQTTDPDADRYYHARTHIRPPEAELSDADIAKGEIDQKYLYWAGDATVYNDPVIGKKVLQMLWMAVHTPGNGDMLNYSKALVKYSLEGTLGDGEYMSIVYREDDFLVEDKGYGSTMCKAGDGHIYLYTTEQAEWDCRTLVARTETEDLASQWYYYIRDLEDNTYKWQTSYPTDEERLRSYIQTNPGTMPWVFKKDDWFYMTYQSFPYGRQIYISRSENPWGPFEDAKLLFTLPEKLDKIGDPYHMHWYMINLHTSLAREGELVFSTNSEAYSFWENFNRPGSADFYRPYFFRVYNWESLFDEEGDETGGEE